jgi:tetratricopeptide (TPR) repeat protein
VLETVRGFGGSLNNQFRYVPLSLLSGRVRQQMGDPAGAAAAFDSARTELSALVAQNPEEAAYRSSLGLALAGLGLDDEAIAEGREGLRLMPPEVEAWRGSWRVIDLARIYAMTGRTNQAIEQLEYVMSIPADLSAWELRLDPTWDALRGDPRFEALTAVD